MIHIARMGCLAAILTMTSVTCAPQSSEPPRLSIKSTAASAVLYEKRVAEQIDLTSYEEQAKALRFRMKSHIMRKKLGRDAEEHRESWAVPLGIKGSGQTSQLAVLTTRCLVDYQYTENIKMPEWSNLALFSSPEGSQRGDVQHQVFRIGFPPTLAGVTKDYDPKRDAWLVKDRMYLSEPWGSRYFEALAPSHGFLANAQLPIGDWNTNDGVDLAVIYFPLNDPGVQSMSPQRNLGIEDPLSLLRGALEGRTRFWGDTFEFSLVSRECMKAARDRLVTARAEADRWKMLAIVAGVAAVAALVVDQPLSGLIESLAVRPSSAAKQTFWQSTVLPAIEAQIKDVLWDQLGRLVVRFGSSTGLDTDALLGGIGAFGLDEDGKSSIIDMVRSVLGQRGAFVSRMDRPDGPPVASILSPGNRMDVGAELLRSGQARLDVRDREILAQQPSLVEAARDALADPDTDNERLADPAYRRAVTEAAGSATPRTPGPVGR